MTANITKTHLSPGEIGAEINVSARRVRGWIKAGTLPAIALGPRTLRIRREDLDTFLRRFPYVRRAPQIH